jgi:hypothetical protein
VESNEIAPTVELSDVEIVHMPDDMREKNHLAETNQFHNVIVVDDSDDEVIEITSKEASPVPELLQRSQSYDNEMERQVKEQLQKEKQEALSEVIEDDNINEDFEFDYDSE